MEFKHEPVLLEQTIQGLHIQSQGIYVDGTLGGAGHSSVICAHLNPQGRLIGIDRDTDALQAASQRLATVDCETTFVHDNYANIKAILKRLGVEQIQGALLDLGVSSYQLDDPARGFSYMKEAPLDMRMNRDDKLTAYDVVNHYDENKLAYIIKAYGEERFAGRIARAIVRAREESPLETSTELVDVIKGAIPAKARREGPHPAKRTFQALRIEVNNELGLLEQACHDFLDVLAPGGRLCVISFHSLEDRIVKNVFNQRANPCQCPSDFPVCVCGKVGDIEKVKGKPITASEEELERNPRARSAKLRVAQKK